MNRLHPRGRSARRLPGRPARRRAPLPVLGLALFACALLFAVPALAQEAPLGDQGFEGQVDVTEVALDVLVTDDDGNVIVGLGPEDFVVEENGERKTVQSVTFYSNRRLATPLPAELEGRVDTAQGPEDRYFVILLEDQRRKDAATPVNLTRRQLRAIQETKEWVQDEMLPGDWVAVTSYDYKLKVQQDFTRNQEAIVQALDAAVKGQDPKGNWPSRTGPAEDGAPSLTVNLPQGEKALRQATPRIEQGLEVLAEALGPIQGRKNVVFFSTGFGEINSLGQYKPDPRYFPPMVRALNDNNVAVYGVDLTPVGVRNTLVDSLNQVASETGGQFYQNFTTFQTPLKRIDDENNGYYLLTYTARHGADEEGFQNVEVTTRNPDFEVRARQGYRFGDSGGVSSR